MSKKSVVVSGLGLGLGMLTNADQVRKKMGVTDEQFHVLATEAGRKHWQRLFESIVAKDENCYETCRVTVGDYKSLKAAIKAGQYDNVQDDKITSVHFPVRESEQREVEISLVPCSGRSPWSRNIIEEMVIEGYSPANHEEILALGAQHPELQLKFAIVALGTIGCVDGHMRVITLYECCGHRKLELERFSNKPWPQSFRFAFVRKNY